MEPTPQWLWMQSLPVTYRVNFKTAMLAHKCIYGNALEYLKDLIKVKSTTRYHLRSDGEMLLEDYSARSKKTLGDRTFKVAAPRIWNILPKDIRKQDNYYSVCAVTWLWRRWKLGSAILEEWNLSGDSSRLLAMPSFCLIIGCSYDKKRRPNLSFCRVPKVITSQGEQTEILSNERRTRWLAAISCDDLTESKLENDRIGGIHFHSGKAPSLWDKFNLDWVPSLHLGTAS